MSCLGRAKLISLISLTKVEESQSEYVQNSALSGV